MVCGFSKFKKGVNDCIIAKPIECAENIYAHGF